MEEQASQDRDKMANTSPSQTKKVAESAFLHLLRAGKFFF